MLVILLLDIYADEGISGTSLKHRDQFNIMIEDCRAGKITLIICKSVSRFARNVVDFLGMVRMLSEHNPPIPEIAEGYSYRLHGLLQEKDNMVCFPISSLDEIKKIGAAEENDG